jgi:GNAT superfamily N-acetyltransferase
MDPFKPRTTIRVARQGEATLLSGIAYRSKAHWGYSDEFLAAARADLTFTEAELAADIVYVLEVYVVEQDVEQDGFVMGFYKLREVTPDRVELVDLFMEPSSIGQGWGRLLWEHAVATATSLGYVQMTWESDPNAEGFYLHMGAERVGAVESSIQPGRFMPRMRYWLTGSQEQGQS